MAKRRKLPFFAISAVTGEGVEALKYAIAAAVTAHRPARVEAEAPAADSTAKRKPHYPPPTPSARGRA